MKWFPPLGERMRSGSAWQSFQHAIATDKHPANRLFSNLTVARGTMPNLAEAV